MPPRAAAAAQEYRLRTRLPCPAAALAACPVSDRPITRNRPARYATCSRGTANAIQVAGPDMVRADNAARPRALDEPVATCGRTL